MIHSPDFGDCVKVRLLCMALVEQLGDDKWYVQLAAIWHWYLPVCIYIMSQHTWELIGALNT